MCAASLLPLGGKPGEYVAPEALRIIFISVESIMELMDSFMGKQSFSFIIVRIPDRNCFLIDCPKRGTSLLLPILHVLHIQGVSNRTLKWTEQAAIKQYALNCPSCPVSGIQMGQSSKKVTQAANKEMRPWSFIMYMLFG